MRTRRTGSPANASEHTFVCLVPTQQVELSSSQEVACSSVVISLSILLSGVWKMSQINIRWANISTTASNDWKGAFKRATVAFWVVSVSPFKSSKWGFPLKVHSCFSFERKCEHFYLLSRTLFCPLNFAVFTERAFSSKKFVALLTGECERKAWWKFLSALINSL